MNDDQEHLDHEETFGKWFANHGERFNRPFCILPWVHIAMNAYGDIKPCCRFNSSHGGTPKKYETFNYPIFSKYKNKPIDAFKSTDANILRTLTLGKEEISGCEKCYFEEDADKQSMRQEQNVKFKRHARHPKPNLVYLELSQSNACNFACIHCSSKFSSKWYDDDILLRKNDIFRGEMPESKYNVIEVDWESVDLSKLEEIKILGGEPFHEQRNLELLETLNKINKLQDITIHTHTNASFIPSEKWIELLQKTKKLTIRISMDGIENYAEYIRYGVNWKKFVKTCKFWGEWKDKNPFQIDLGYHCVVMIYNLFNINEMNSWIIKNNQDRKVMIKFDCLIGPDFLNISILPDYWKEAVSNYLDNTLKDKKMILKFMESGSFNSEQVEKMIKYTKLLDRSRNNSIFEIDTLLTDMFMRTDGLVKASAYKVS